MPLPNAKAGIIDECNEKCKKAQNPVVFNPVLFCCVDECIEENFPFYIDGKLNVKNILGSFSDDMEVKNMSVAEWQTTFEASIAACDKLGRLCK